MGVSSVLVEPAKRGGRGFGKRRKQQQRRGRTGKRWRKRGKRRREVGEESNSIRSPPSLQMEGGKPGKFEESKGAKTLVVFASDKEKEKVKGRECEHDLNCSPGMACLDLQCLPRPFKGENLVDNTHLVAVVEKAVDGGDIKMGKTVEIEERGSAVGNETVSSQGDVGRGYSEEEIWGEEMKNGSSTDGILLAEVRSIRFGKEEIRDSSVKEGNEVDGKYEKEYGLEKGEPREVELLKDENGGGLEQKKSGTGLLQESTRSAGRIQFKFEPDTAAVASLLEDRSLRSPIHDKGSTTEGNNLEDEGSAGPLKENTGCGHNCRNLSDRESKAKEQKTLEGSSLDLEPLQEDSGVDSSEERPACGKDCRNRAHEEGFPEEQETTQCPQGMMLDVWGYCRFDHFFASTCLQLFKVNILFF